MSYSLDVLSASRLKQLHPHLQAALTKVLASYPFQITYALRTREEQQKAFDSGHSEVPGSGEYPHMPRPDGVQAVDLRPIASAGPLSWDVKNPEIAASWGWFISYVFHAIKEEVERAEPGKWEVISGMNWDGDLDILTDQKFDDYGHVEIKLK